MEDILKFEIMNLLIRHPQLSRGDMKKLTEEIFEIIKKYADIK